MDNIENAQLIKRFKVAWIEHPTTHEQMYINIIKIIYRDIIEYWYGLQNSGELHFALGVMRKYNSIETDDILDYINEEQLKSEL